MSKAKTKRAAETQEVTESTVVVTAPTIVERPEPTAPEAVEPASYEVRLEAADAECAGARLDLDAAKRAYDAAQARRDALVDERAATADPQAEGKAGRAWLERQNEIRAERVLRAQRIADALGVKGPSAGLSPLDRSLINRPRQSPRRPLNLGSVGR
jgi:LPS O-antigen subunit length determinant protein (WzzB/FepE family)